MSQSVLIAKRKLEHEHCTQLIAGTCKPLPRKWSKFNPENEQMRDDYNGSKSDLAKAKQQPAAMIARRNTALQQRKHCFVRRGVNFQQNW